MIKFLQSGNKAAKYLLVAMLTILSLSMVTYLIPGFMSDTNITDSRVLASVGGHQITTQDVQRMVGQMQRQQRLPDFYVPMLNQRAALGLIQQAELSYEADRMGLSVSDQEVRDYMHSGVYGATLYPGGNWIGQEKFDELLRENQTTEEELISQLRFELLRKKMVAAATAGVSVSPAEVEKAYKDQNTKVKFDYAIINADDLQKTINPTDAELKAFYDAEKGRYQNSIPEKRQIRYFLIPEQQAQKQITISPVELEKWYRDNEDQFRTQDRVKVRHILIATPQVDPGAKPDPKAVEAARAKAEDVLKQVKAGGDFAALAKKYSDDPGSKDTGGELGWQGHDSAFVPEFKQAMFALNKGQISDLVQSPFGFHIIQVEDKETAGLKSLAEVKSTVEENVRRDKTSDLLNQMATNAQTDATNHGLDKAAAKLGDQVIETPNPISRNDSLPGVGQSPELMNSIFMVKENSGVQVAQSTQGYIIFQVMKVVPPSTPDFESIKARVATDFKNERISTLVQTKTTELADRAHSLHDLRKAAKEAGATVKSSDLVGRDAQVPEIGSMGGSASVAFKLKAAEISGPVNTGRNGLVIAVTDRQEPLLNGPDFAKASDNLREQIMETKRQDAEALFLSNVEQRLQKEGKVKLNQSAMDNITRGRS